MRGSFWIIILTTIACTFVYVIVTKFSLPPFRWQAKLINPAGKLTEVQYKFDKSTDLKKELDLVNPKVEDSDFKDLDVAP